MPECELQALIARAEAATEETQHVVIYDALVYAHKREWISDGQYDSAMRKRNVGAFIDAALTLVPEGWRWAVGTYQEAGEYFAACQSDELTQEGFNGDVGSATPALSLCVAALKAREAEG